MTLWRFSGGAAKECQEGQQANCGHYLALYCPSWHSFAAPPCSVLPLLPFACCPSWHSFTAPPAFCLLPLLPFTCCPSCLLLAAPPAFCFLPLPTFLCCPSCLYLLPLLPFACCPSYCNFSFAAPPSWPSWPMSLDKLTVFQVDCYGSTGCGVAYRILYLSWPSSQFKFKFCFVDRSSKFWKLIECHELEIQVDPLPTSDLNFVLWIGVPNFENWLNAMNWNKLTVLFFVDRSAKFWKLIDWKFHEFETQVQVQVQILFFVDRSFKFWKLIEFMNWKFKLTIVQVDPLSSSNSNSNFVFCG